MGKYSAGLARMNDQELLRPGASYMLLGSAVSTSVVISQTATYFGYPGWDRAVTWGVFVIITILDDDPSIELPEGVTALFGEEARQALRDGRFHKVYKSPGISLYDPDIALAKANGSAFCSAANLWFEQNPNTIKIVVCLM